MNYIPITLSVSSNACFSISARGGSALGGHGTFVEPRNGFSPLKYIEKDKYGNWKYELTKSLVDGEHEVYVAINDNTGKVINKSKPLNFFVKKAEAVSVKDFVSSVSAATPPTPKKSETLVNNYSKIAFLFVIFGILLFVAVITKRKKKALK